MQNQFININQTLTMSTREISKLLNKEHANIKISAERLAEKSVISTLALQEFEHNGNKYTEYMLNKRDTLVLVAQNCPEFTAVIVDRWQELESKSNLTVFGQDTSTHRGALLALVASLDKIEADKPKVAYFDNLVNRNLLVNIRDSAKEIGIKQNEFVKWLLENKYVYRDAKEHLKPYAQHTPELFELKEYINPHNGQAGNQLLTTPRGRETFNLLINGIQ